MKKIITLLVLTVILLQVNSQTTDSVDMNSEYTMDVFYSLDNGSQQTVAGKEWTIAFSTGAQTSSAYINDGRDVVLYETNVAIGNFNNTIDTSGIGSWPEVTNDYSDWAHSAFEFGATGHPNYGWGEYNSATHIVTGTKVFVLKVDSNYYKVSILKKELGAWHFRYASLDNSFDSTLVYQSSDLPNKNFVYFNIYNHSVLDREPANSEWDLLFTRYHNPNPFYAVTGVLLNKGVEVVEIDGVNPDNASYVGATFQDATDIIGWDWKEFNMTNLKFEIDSDRTFFVKQLDGDIYKVNFNRFDGASTGKIEFNKEKIIVSAIESIDNINSVSLYPNPANNNTSLVLDVKEHTEISYEIFNLVGKQLRSENKTLKAGLNVLNLDVSNFSEGIYLIQLQNGAELETLKLKVSK